MTTPLEKLLHLGEKRPDRSRPASVRIDYSPLSQTEDVDSLHRTLERAEHTGAVTLRRGGTGRRHLIEAVILRDANALARFLGRTPAPDRAAELRRQIAPYATAAPWLTALADEAAGRWARADGFCGLAPDDARAVVESFALAAVIARGLADGIDPRSLSIRAGLDSKAFHRNESRVVAMLRIGLELAEADMDRDEVIAAAGIVKFPHPVLLHGPLALIADTGGMLASGTLRPYIGLPPDPPGTLRLSARPSALLTVENFASFNRHITEARDGALVVYVGGFPSPGTIRLLTRILETLPVDIQFLHWGDIDAGGVRIFRHLETTLPRPPRPHLMTAALARAHGVLADPEPRLARLAATGSAIAELAGFLAQPGAMTLEQEVLDPVPLAPPAPPVPPGDAS